MNSNNVIFWVKTNQNKIPSTKKFDSKEIPKNYLSLDKNLRPWDPYSDTLSAAIMSGLEFLPINYKTNILYFGFFNQEKILHFLDLTNNSKQLIFKTNNVKQHFIHEKVSVINEICELENQDFSDFDTIFFNEKNFSLEQILDISQKYLKKNGYLIIRRSKENKENINKFFKNLRSSIEILQEVNIENFFKNEIMIISKMAVRESKISKI